MCGETALVSKRVLIMGEGELGAATLEQRGNAPAFTIQGPAVLMRLAVDLCGFRECVQVVGPLRGAPALLISCTMRSSGHEGCVVEGGAAPVLRDCQLAGRRAALCCLDDSAPKLLRCRLHSSGMQGLRAQGRSRPTLRSCTIEGNEAEGVVCFQHARVAMDRCTVSKNQGCGLDVSGSSSLSLTACSVQGNVGGGLFMWDTSNVSFDGGRISAETGCLAVLVDSGPRLRLRRCSMAGVVHAQSREVEAELAEAGCPSSDDGWVHCLPAEAGCFKFEADRFTRKQ